MTLVWAYLCRITHLSLPCPRRHGFYNVIRGIIRSSSPMYTDFDYSVNKLGNKTRHFLWITNMAIHAKHKNPFPSGKEIYSFSVGPMLDQCQQAIIGVLATNPNVGPTILIAMSLLINCSSYSKCILLI